MNQYQVTHIGGCETTVTAKDGTHAKRIACRELGYSPSDYWLGLTAMKARKLN